MGEFAEGLKKDRLRATKALADLAMSQNLEPADIQARANALAVKSNELVSNIEQLAKILNCTASEGLSVNLGIFDDGYRYEARPTVADGSLLGFRFFAEEPSSLDGIGPVEVRDVFFALGGASSDDSASELVLEEGEARWHSAFDSGQIGEPDFSVLQVAEEGYDRTERTLEEVWRAVTATSLNALLADRAEALEQA